MANRKRNKAIDIKLSEAEYKKMIDKYKASNSVSLTNFIIESVTDSKITSVEELQELKNFNRQISEIVKQIKGACTNLNQIAHVANSTGYIDVDEADKLVSLIQKERNEVERLWQSIRYSQVVLGRKVQ